MVDVGDGLAVRVLASGTDGPLTPVLLVHGLASNAHLWDGVSERLAASGHPVAAVDLRGHGASSKPVWGYDFGTIASDLAAVVRQLGWAGGSPPVAVGQSWGANVVLELSVRHPGLTGALVLVDGGTIELADRFPDWRSCAAALAPPNLAGTTAEAFEALVRRHHPDWPDSGVAGTLANMEVLDDGTVRPWLERPNHMRILHHLWEHHPSGVYPRVEVPVLIVAAGQEAGAGAGQEAGAGAGQEAGAGAGQEAGAGAGGHGAGAKRAEVERAAKSLARSATRWVAGDHDLHAQHPALVSQLVHDAAVGSPFS